MKLTILDRIVMLGLLPVEGNFRTMRIVRELQSNLSFSEEELAEHQIVQVNSGQVKWANESNSYEKDILVGAVALELIKQKLIKLNSEEALNKDHLELYEELVVKEDE
jgi:hypothetical protein